MATHACARVWLLRIKSSLYVSGTDRVLSKLRLCLLGTMVAFPFPILSMIIEPKDAIVVSK
jgi:hypothetical protein